MNALETQGLGHRYKRTALDAVSFTVGRGEFVVLLGLNGAGKTTLFSLIAGLLPLQTGALSVLGHALPQERTRALARCGFVFQQPALDLDLTLAETLAYHAALHGVSRRDAFRRIDAELARCGLADRKRDLVRTLSGGQRRRVEIARCLLHEVDLLVLDEPTVGLDMPSRKAILDRVRAVCRETGCTVLLATHLLDEIAEGDRIIVLHEGRIVDDGTTRTAREPLPRRFARLVGLEAAA
ncbi:MAG: ATP-binding cassette domain-containing protein [Alphaproteobacteria bacterium]|nr:ATP-binding cassette domain-containing protein [Alphaproteobacteria bacterium]